MTYPPNKLEFDRQNPRLAEYGITKDTSDLEIVRILWEEMDVEEIILSLTASGFFTHEPLLVAVENKKNVVIEGNRRLAALRILTDNDLREKLEIPAYKLSAPVKKSLKEIPCVVLTRKEAWRLLGFKHVNGAQRWRSYAKANYIANVHREYGVSLAEISTQIGDNHNTVRRLYRGLMVLEEAERLKVYNRADRSKQHLSFSHLYTGLDLTGFKDYLNLADEEDETDDPVPKKNKVQLGNLLTWLYGSKSQGLEPKVVSQNPDLRRLAKALTTTQGRLALEANKSLEEAWQASRPATNVFDEALIEAKLALQKAKAHMTDGYDGSLELLKIAGSIANQADSLYSEMERIHEKISKPTSKPRLTE